jgi:FADH2 O2-dependent halogenase
MPNTTDKYDVAILGSGLAGSCLAAILARHGKRTLLLEGQQHPRFAIGESVVPEFGARAHLLALAYDVPELADMANFQLVRHRVSSNSGVKRNFTFLHHGPGNEHRSEHTSQFETMTYPLGPDTHIYRADLDSWLTGVAIQYGAVYRDRSPVEDVDFRDDGATVSAGGRDYEADFVLDTTGFRSILASKFDLRSEVELATNSRSIFTHMAGVASIMEARRQDDPLGIPSPPDQGTLHHLFDGGWFWVIPFDNHEQATNATCSVGLTLDRRVHPDNDLSAEEEFQSFVQRFPTVAKQFENARAVRGWVKTGRIQYQSKRLAGDRWCLLPHAAAFVDPLFSGGMPLTLLGVHQVARIVMDAVDEGSFEAQRFAGLEEDAFENLQLQDKLIHSAYIAFRSPALFNAWYRIWALGNYHATLSLYRLSLNYKVSGRREFIDEASRPRNRRLLGMGLPRMRTLLEDGHDVLRRLDDGEADEAQTLDALFGLLGKADWAPPSFHLTERARRYIVRFTVLPLLRMIFWGKRNAPEDMRVDHYDIGPVYFRELMRTFGREARRGLSSFWHVVKDAHY